MSLSEDRFTSTVDGAAAHAEQFDPDFLGHRLPSPPLPPGTPTRASEPYISLPDIIRRADYARRPCPECGLAVSSLTQHSPIYAHHTARYVEGAELPLGRCPGGTDVIG